MFIFMLFQEFDASALSLLASKMTRDR